MNFGNVNRRVINSDIIQARLDRRTLGNVWDYVTKINKDLTNNPITENNSIIVRAEFAMDQNIIDRLIDIYGVEGWTVTYTRSETSQNGFSGETEMTFTPL